MRTELVHERDTIHLPNGCMYHAHLCLEEALEAHEYQLAMPGGYQVHSFIIPNYTFFYLTGFTFPDEIKNNLQFVRFTVNNQLSLIALSDIGVHLVKLARNSDIDISLVARTRDGKQAGAIATGGPYTTLCLELHFKTVQPAAFIDVHGFNHVQYPEKLKDSIRDDCTPIVYETYIPPFSAYWHVDLGAGDITKIIIECDEKPELYADLARPVDCEPEQLQPGAWCFDCIQYPQLSILAQNYSLLIRILPKNTITRVIYERMIDLR